MTPTRGFGRAGFASALLSIGGTLNVIYGIAAIDHARFFASHLVFVSGSLRTWGWIALVLGIAEIAAAASILRGGDYGRMFGILVAGLSAIGALLAIPAYPLLSVSLFALWLWVIHGLSVYDVSPPQSRGA